jgi:hypothetical protein
MADLSDPAFWIPTAISIIAVVLFYLDMRWRIKREEKASGELAQVVVLLKEELDLFRKQERGGQLSSHELQRQRDLPSQTDIALKNLVTGLKALKLAKEILGEE